MRCSSSTRVQQESTSKIITAFDEWMIHLQRRPLKSALTAFMTTHAQVKAYFSHTPSCLQTFVFP